VDTFESNYRDNLVKLEQIDLPQKALSLGLEMASAKIVLPFFGRAHYIARPGVVGPDGVEPTPAVAAVLLEYLLRNEWLRPAAAAKITFRDVQGAGPLVDNFAHNTNRLIAQTFAGRREALESACKNLDGTPFTDTLSADLNMKFTALPEVPLYLSFNDRDEDFPAQCSLLFEKSAEQYLSMKSLFVLGTTLAGSLIKFAAA